MLSYFNDVTSANVDDGASNTLRRLNDDIVVLAHLESIKGASLPTRNVKNSFIDGIRNTVVDELGKDQTILAFVEHLKCIGRERQPTSDLGVACQDSVDMTSKLCSLILVNGVGDIGA